MTERPWHTIESAPYEVAVETKLHDNDGERNRLVLFRSGGLWFFPKGSRYVKYTPTHWRPVEISA